MRYFKKCEACNGQGIVRQDSKTFSFSQSCMQCERGFVDCTSEVEAMRELLGKIAGLYGVLKYSETQELADEAKALLKDK